MPHSKKFTILFYVAMIVLLAASTLVTIPIYDSLWFFSLWGVSGITIIAAIVKFKLWRQIPSMMLHCSFLFILAGGAMTFIFGEKGYLTMQPGQTATHFIIEGTENMSPLPTAITLDSFVVVNHQASMIPRNYVSYLSHGGNKSTVSVNNILEIDGYRIYQSSFNASGETILSINHDPWGIALTYTGYILFGVATLLFLFYRNGRFRSYLRKASLVVVCLTVSSVSADASTIKGVPYEDACHMARQQVFYNGRIAPFNTLAHDFVMKITGKTSYAGLSPEQIVASWVLYSDDWKKRPFIMIKSQQLRNELGFDHKYVSYNDLFTSDGTYKLKTLYTLSDNGLNRDILDVDEKVELIYMLLNGQLIKPVTKDSDLLPDQRISAEIIYNKIPFAKIFFISAIVLALLFTAVAIAKPHFTYYMSFIAAILMIFQTTGYFLKWYIAQSIPLSNGPETMQFLSIIILIIALAICRRNIFILPLSMLLAGFFGLVAHLGNNNPSITPLIPVLNSPWLSIHVSVIMISYAILALTMLISIIALCIKNERERLMWLNKALLYPGVLLLGCGIFIGAVWANISWGRYWGWDPKEVWALVTMMIYAMALHSQSLKRFNNPLFLHIFCIAAFVSVLITYFGVNYFLGGMHSYA